MPWKRMRSWRADMFATPKEGSLVGSGRMHRRDCCKRAVVSTAFSGAGTHPHPYQPRLRLSGNFLCRVDWLSVRGTAQPERTVLSILEVLTYSRCCSSGQSSSGERSSARRSLPARTWGEPFNKAYARMFWSDVRPSQSTSNIPLSQTSHLFTFWFHGKGKETGQQVHCVALVQIPFPWTTANKISHFSRHCSHTQGGSARTTRLFYRAQPVRGCLPQSATPSRPVVESR